MARGEHVAARSSGSGRWQGALALATALYAVFVAYPFVLNRRARDSRDPYFTAVLGSVFFFFAARSALLAGGLQAYIGIVPVAEGVVMALILRQLLRVQPAEERDLGRLAVVAAASLSFATVAIPLQLDNQWITIGWALEGAALAWLYRRVPHKGLLYAASALLAVVFVRLALNPAIFLYEPRGSMRIINWYLYTYLTCGAAMLLAAWWLSKTDDRIAPRLPRTSSLLPAGAVIVLFILLNIEVADFYATGPEITFRFGVTLAQDLTYTLCWLVFGLGLLTSGIYLHNRYARIAAVALIAVTTSKAFLYDLGSLGGLYRVGSLVGLAVSLAARRAGVAEVRAARAQGTAMKRSPGAPRRAFGPPAVGRPGRPRSPLVMTLSPRAGQPAPDAAFRFERPIIVATGGPHRLAIDVPLLVGGNAFRVSSRSGAAIAPERHRRHRDRWLDRPAAV